MTGDKRKPTSTAWKSGESGNPNGRPAGTGEVAKVRAAIADRVPELLAALEQASPHNEPMTIIRRIVSPGHFDAEIDHIRDGDGKEWTRQPVETEDAFIGRATGETRANECGVKRLIASNAELHRAESCKFA